MYSSAIIIFDISLATSSTKYALTFPSNRCCMSRRVKISMNLLQSKHQRHVLTLRCEDSGKQVNWHFLTQWSTERPKDTQTRFSSREVTPIQRAFDANRTRNSSHIICNRWLGKRSIQVLSADLRNGRREEESGISFNNIIGSKETFFLPDSITESVHQRK